MTQSSAGFRHTGAGSNQSERYPVKRHLHVACAIITQDGNVLAAQRSAETSLPLKWEFPGGKIETGETPQICLERELQEELGAVVTIEHTLPQSTYSYADFTVTLYPFVCRLAHGTVTPHEHHALKWVRPDQMYELDWAEADLPVIRDFLETVRISAGNPR